MIFEKILLILRILFDKTFLKNKRKSKNMCEQNTEDDAYGTEDRSESKFYFSRESRSRYNRDLHLLPD